MNVKNETPPSLEAFVAKAINELDGMKTASVEEKIDALTSVLKSLLERYKSDCDIPAE